MNEYLIARKMKELGYSELETEQELDRLAAERDEMRYMADNSPNWHDNDEGDDE